LIEAKAPAPAPTSPKKTSDAAPDTGGIELEDAEREALA
jgi:hypothetical protein